MNEFHPSTSAVGSHMDEQMEIAALAQRFYEEEGRPEGRAQEHWMRAEREFHRRTSPVQEESLTSDSDYRTEEAMHLDL